MNASYVTYEYDGVLYNFTDIPTAAEKEAYVVQVVIYCLIQFMVIIGQVYLFALLICFNRNNSGGKTAVERVGKEPFQKRCILMRLLMFVLVTGIPRSAYMLHILFRPNFKPSSGTECTTDLNVFYVLFAVGLTVLYVFLWYRQYTLYSLPNMQRLVSRSMTRFSIFLLPVIIASGTFASVSLVLVNPPHRIVFIPKYQICLFIPAEKTKLFYVRVVFYALLLLYQATPVDVIIAVGSLLFCFLYILRRHQKETKRFQLETNVITQSSRSLRRLMKNCLTASLVAMTTDATTVVVSFLLPSSAPLYTLAIYDLDFFINVLCALFCFSSWRHIVTSCICRSSTPKTTPQSGVASSKTSCPVDRKFEIRMDPVTQ